MDRLHRIQMSTVDNQDAECPQIPRQSRYDCAGKAKEKQMAFCVE